MIQWKQQSMGLEPFGLSYGNPDFIRYAESYGALGYRVTEARELKQLLTYCFATGSGVHLIEVPIDYRENERVLTQELQEKTCAF